MFSQFIDSVFSGITKAGFDTLIWIIWGSFAAVFAVAVLLCAFKPKARARSKRPFLALANCYTALTLAAFLTAESLAKSIFAASLFWCAAYLLYGALCAFKPREERAAPSAVSLSTVQTALPRTVHQDVPAAKCSVRLEHAISVTDKLLQKNPGKSDRQELEKLKSTLSVLQLKGSLTPAEADILNENFNALLKLMAKYNV